ncbi:uncharacterized protein KY384_008157 [Bacidia gigantensis]|uniref:uncharacterized protein n=1 Tax=Bacidia gigantensis TaxID=2732470 RepID=UPI001D05894F|nr:uncharacterized protein KY384_008157 [Bacidia gigantensis]KAG8526728.1 hypothetical protein KY384_008157 [Bacidia gigantensis]
MPLILISGFPCSGKTHRAKQLLDLLKPKIDSSSDERIRKLTVHLINDQSLGVSRGVYREAKTEKDARAAELSAVKRLLSRDAIVIADGLNYIKGFRYQLYCEAKAVRTPSCVVHVGTPATKCGENNDRLLSEAGGKDGYEQDIFENLIFRYEEPNGMTRWDSPLFTVPIDDTEPPVEQIWDAIIGSDGQMKMAKPNAATITPQATESDYLYELDRSTQEVVSSVLDWQKDHPGESGEEIKCGSDTIVLPSNPVSLPQLQRIRRQFTNMNRQTHISKSRIRTLFVEYLNDNLG